jgi:flagellar hook-associated protein 1 FlgK
MGTGIVNTGISGLQAAQLGLLTTEHNITNASTPGFNRQRTVQATNTAMQTGAGFIGQGTHVATITRMYDSFLSAQVNRTQTTNSELEAYNAQIKQIDNMLADSTAGVSPALQSFFASVQQVSANPSQLPARQAMVSSAQALVTRYQDFGDRINEIYDGVNSQIRTAVSSINSYATQIASLNEAIVVAGSSNGQPPNDLLDQRDQLVFDLNKLIKVSTTTNSDGTFNVYIGNGQQLVTGAQVNGLTALPSAADVSRFVVGLQPGTGLQELPESLITGGSLGGLLKFRSETLDRVAADLGRNAASLALTFNAQNALGQDLNGNIAGSANFVANFFNVPTPTVAANTLNPATSPTVSVAYTTPPPFNGNFYTDLTNSDYRLDYNGANLTLTRLSDNTQWSGATVAALNTVLAQPGNAQGFSLNPAAFVAADAGASYLIQPTRFAASNISVNASAAADPRLLAAAAPIRTQAASGNSGGALISAGTVATGYTAPAAGSPLTLTYAPPVLPATSGTLSWPATGTIAAGTVPYTSGATITIANISFQISGAPDNGDTFTIARNSGGVSDGRNALALGQLQTQNTMSGMNASYQAAYAELVSDVGNKSREIEVKSTAQTALLKEATDARDSLSGVNLDEEAGNLMRYQQAYQASAKMMDIGNKLFDTLLASMS